MKTKLFTLLFAIAVGTGAVLAEEINGICYYINYSAGFAGVTYGKNYSGNVTIPDKISYNGKVLSVVAIGENAFKNCTNLTSVTIPNSVEVIYDYAFSGCIGLTNLTIPNSVTRIKQYAFSGCTGLTNLTIPNSVTSIGGYAFNSVMNINYSGTATGSPWGAMFVNCYVDGYLVYSNSKKTDLLYCSKSANGKITIPNSVKSIASGVFSGCTSITSVTIPNDVTSMITSSAFKGCSSLISITLPNGITSLGDYAFDGCSNLSSIIIPDNVTSIGYCAFRGCSSLESITFGHNMTTFGRYAFQDCNNITNVVWNVKNYPDCQEWYKTPFYLVESNSTANYDYDIRESIASFTFGEDVEHIPAFLCYGLKNITSINIPSSVKSIGSNAFCGCSKLSIVKISSIAAWCAITFGSQYSNPLTSAHHLYLNNAEVTNITVPNGIASLGNYVFSGGSNITEVTIPNSVTSIGNSAFYGCSGLTSMTIPNSVTSIGNSAFYGCSSLTSMTIPNSVTSIAISAFYDCSNMTSVTINSNEIVSREYKSNSTIGSIFGSQVTEYILGNEVTSIGDYAFYKCTNLNKVVIGKNTTIIGHCAFSGCTSLSTINFSNNVTNIGNSAFSGCVGLTNVSIPNNVTSIGESAFYNCTGLMNANIPNGAINNYSFFGCSNLTSIILGDNVTSIGASAFSGCTGLTNVTIPNSVTSIGEWAFSDCSNLSSVTLNSDSIVSKTYTYFNKFKDIFGSQVTNYILGSNVTRIGDYAFYNCTALTSVTIPNSVTSIGEWAFSDCSGLTSVTIPNSVTSIGNYTFYNCSGLTSVTIPNSVTSIGEWAFSDCSGLTSVTIPNSVTSIGEWAFYRCSGMTSVIIPNSVASIGISVFSGCSGLTSVTIPNGVTSIGNSVFANCSSLTSVIWRAKNCASPSEYKNAPFYDIRSQIKTFVLGDEVENIPAYLCYGMNQIATITIPNSVESIGNSAFQGCGGLTSLILPQQVTSIGEYSFNYCNSLTNVTLQSETPPSLGNNAFSNCSNLLGIYVPCGKLEAYKRAWSKYTSYIVYTPTGYTINAGINMTEAGNVAILNSVCETSVTANSNYGYHFAQWSDGNTDNPRVIELTSDTTFTAEFAKNSYSIATATSPNAEWGTTSGDATVLYQDQVEISATANYGYHFVQWNDGNSSNPRTITVTKDASYIATFAKNTYRITKITDNTQGSISGYSQAYYLDQVTLTAVPKYGYHFTQWSDGETENPRTFVLTRDTTFTAEFAVDKSGTCGNNNLLTWEFDAESKTLAISGEGKLNNNYTFGVEAPTQTERLIIEDGVTSIGNNAFKNKCSTITALALPSTVTTIGDYAFAGLNNRKFNTLVLPNTIVSIGAHAFDGASYLQKIHFGSVLEEIGDYAFNGCTRVREMTCLAEITPNVGTDGLTSISDLATLYVPNDYLFDYQLDNNWKRFVLKPIGATETTVTGNDVTIVADDNTATITWPTSEADSYTIEITKDGEVFCRLIFNANGQLTGIAFAPSRDGQSMAPAATMTASGMQFTVTGLNSGTSYGYTLEAKSGDTTVASYSGSFATTGGIATSIDETNASSVPQKVLRDGQVLILRDGKTYDLQGQEVR